MDCDMMKRTINNHHLSPKFIKEILLLSVFLFNFPENYIGQCTAVQNSSSFQFQSVKNNVETDAPSSQDLRTKGYTIDDENYQLVTGNYVIISIISFLMTIISLVLTLSYLKSVSVSKECVLLYLYKDVVMVWISLNILWLARVVLTYFNESKLGMTEFQAKCISFGISVLLLSVIFILNGIRMIKLYVAKTRTIDPPMLWGEDERLGIKAIRISCAALSIGIVSIEYALGLYPKFYYFFTIEHHTSLIMLNYHSSIQQVLMLVMTVSCILIFLAEKYYKSINNNSNDQIIPRQMDYFTWVFLIAVVLFILIYFSGAYQIFKHTDRLEIVQAMLTIILVLPPAVVLLRTKQLMSYAIRTLKEIQYETFLLSIYLTPSFLFLIINGTLYLL